MQKQNMTKQIKKKNSPVFSLASLSAGPGKPYSRQLTWSIPSQHQLQPDSHNDSLQQTNKIEREC